jgi:hypothetical protein
MCGFGEDFGIVYVVPRAFDHGTVIHESAHIMDCSGQWANALVNFQQAVGASCRQNPPACAREDYNSIDPLTNEEAWDYFKDDNPNLDVSNAREDFAVSFHTFLTAPRTWMIDYGDGNVPVPGGWDPYPLRYHYMKELVQGWQTTSGVDALSCQTWIQEIEEINDTSINNDWATYICKAIEE